MDRRMSNNVIEQWHQVLRNKDMALLSDLLADNVVFYSPVVHTPQQGKQLTYMYLYAAANALYNDTFKYVKEIIDMNQKQAVLEFEVEHDGILVNGIDMLTWNDVGKIIEFKVMLRPLKAVNLIHQQMGNMLASMKK